MSGFVTTGVGASAMALGAGAVARNDGIVTVRCASFPLAEILGVPIWRESTRGVCVSIRWSAISIS